MELINGIAFRKIPEQEDKSLQDEIKKTISELIDSGDYFGASIPKSIAEFEDKLARFCNVKHAIAVSSGTTAIDLAVRTLGLKKGDKVLTVGNTFVATIAPIVQNGFEPVFVDIKSDTGLMDVDKIEEYITDDIKAIIPVHLYGNPVNMSAINELKMKYGLQIIEDCAQAIGTFYNGKHVGTFADLGCFSFYPGKNLGTIGEGGAVVTNDDQLADGIKKLRNHGGYYDEGKGYIGTNARMGAIEGAILNIKIDHINEWNDRRTQIAKKYDEALRNVSGIKLLQTTTGGKHSYHLYVIRVEAGIGIDRFQLQEKLAAKGIECRIHYPQPVYDIETYKRYNYGRTIETTNHCKNILSLPIHPYLTDDEADRVIYEIKSIFRQVD